MGLTPDKSFSPTIAKRNVAAIYRGVRKSLGISQRELAQRIGISQTRISVIEKGLEIPSAYHWDRFCDEFDFDLKCIHTGQVEYRNALHIPKLKSLSQFNGFEIPNRYLNDCGSTVRTAGVFYRYAMTELGKVKFDELLEFFEIDPDYFVFVDHQINIQLVYDLLDALIQKGRFGPDTIQKLIATLDHERFHGQVRYRYLEINSPIQATQSLIDSAHFFECNHTYRVIDKKLNILDVSITPNEHLSGFRVPDLVGPSLCEYKKLFLQTFAKWKTGKTIWIEELECQYKKGAKCVYRVAA